ncbi:DUF1850 domain-containing protein [Haloplanus rubicundus]|uniref:DUF1850 domain-containing protein n=1 Tax=Haloplanus rubicundus TaxID=1547898 RepID=A0A345E8Q4_9EURY|nr:DUF1850 domain-containing protein [Haloplanus rubicundus]AXG08576.1 DUF1850 domain-containing protein [Haloplanus rubicundus]
MKRRYVAAVAFVVLVAALGSAAAVPDRRVLVVSDAETGETYLETPVDNGTVVALEYTHSVEKTRVYEAYTIRGDRLEMTHMEFESYGWGLPSRANVTRKNGTFIYDPPGSYERLTVAPGRIAGHRLHVGDETHDLVALSNGRSVTLSIHRRSAFALPLHGVDR